MVPEAMRAAYMLKAELGLETRILNVHTVKPWTRPPSPLPRRYRCRHHCRGAPGGGFGNLIAGAITQADIPRPVRLRMIGVQDKFGESGQPWELMKVFGLTAEHIAQQALKLLR